MQWPGQTWPWRYDLKAARGQAGQRSGSARSHRQRPPSCGDYFGDATEDWNLLSSTPSEALMATSVSNTLTTQEKLLRARGAAATLAQLSTGEKNSLLLAIADAIESNA